MSQPLKDKKAIHYHPLLSKNNFSILFCSLNSILSKQEGAKKCSLYVLSSFFMCVSVCMYRCNSGFLCCDKSLYVLFYLFLLQLQENVKWIMFFFFQIPASSVCHWAVWYSWALCPSSVNWMMSWILTDYIWFMTLFLMLISFFLVTYAPLLFFCWLSCSVHCYFKICNNAMDGFIIINFFLGISTTHMLDNYLC